MSDDDKDPDMKWLPGGFAYDHGGVIVMIVVGVMIVAAFILFNVYWG